jgi:ribosomal protein S18 acetylase RimI-like enzyme
MMIRSATLGDLGACLALDANSQTDHVWQMDAREEHGGMVIRFHTVRLPRIMRVTYPRPREDLLSCWESGATILVVTNEPAVGSITDQIDPSAMVEPAPIFGYCQFDVYPWQQTGWISHLIVDRPFRRHGIGTAMLKAAIAWGREKGLQRLMIAVQTKNYPAISFCEKHGFTFCGFNDYYFVNRDIALFHSLKI